jgi:hypothetical protein
MPPIIDRPSLAIMGALDDPPVLAKHLAFGDTDDALQVNAQAHRPIGEGGRHFLTAALQMDEAGRRHPFAIFDKAIERPRKGHQGRRLVRPDLGYGSERLAALFQPVVQSF